MPRQDYVTSAWAACLGAISSAWDAACPVKGDVTTAWHEEGTPTNLPDQFANLVLWLKADAIVGFNDGDNLTSWISSEGNAYSFTKPSYASGYPVFKTGIVNGKPVARHVGSGAGDNRRLGFTHASFSAATVTLFAVMAWKTATSPMYRYGPGCRQNSVIGYGLNRSDNGFTTEYNVALVGLDTAGAFTVGQGSNIAEPAAEQNGVFHIAELARVTGSGFGYFTNGVQRNGLSPVENLVASTGPFSTAQFFDTGVAENLVLGRTDIDIAEIALYNRGLTASERTLIRAGLAEKYGIAGVV